MWLKLAWLDPKAIGSREVLLNLDNARRVECVQSKDTGAVRAVFKGPNGEEDEDIFTGSAEEARSAYDAVAKGLQGGQVVVEVTTEAGKLRRASK